MYYIYYIQRRKTVKEQKGETFNSYIVSLNLRGVMWKLHSLVKIFEFFLSFVMKIPED